MKKYIFLYVFILISMLASAQNYYWVYFTDKAGTEFDPYKYFDSKAIERRLSNGISLYDISDYPLNDFYKSGVEKFSSEIIGESRWFNSIAIYTSEENANYISGFNFVKKVSLISNDASLASINNSVPADPDKHEDQNVRLLPQVRRMGGEEFTASGIDGKGIRIAVFDAGFPGADTHPAFKHLRDNKQIIKTWNFPKKCENVYGWNSHGTMVLSCIAGIYKNGEKMGLATGSEFLLARTEVGAEPAKEEVWWMMAVEWADKNGADVINSSLGYGADRHSVEEMDGKTSIVTKAANMAASKGMLVCNSIGNEGDDRSWKTMGAPADADSILSIGGTDPENDAHISFSSYGPTADGRMKPNVSAYGTAKVANPDGSYGEASGTSFSSPLVAGFAACAWQTRKGYSAMEMKSEIEKSADMFPYFDYATGYGIPQAGYFTNNTKPVAEKSFEITQDNNYVYIKPVRSDYSVPANIWYHIENKDGQLEYYSHAELWFGSDEMITLKKEALSGDRTLRVFYKGYTESLKLKPEEMKYSTNIKNIKIYPAVMNGQRLFVSRFTSDNKPAKFGANAKYYIHPYFAKSFITPPAPAEYNLRYMKSGSFNFGIRYKRNFAKAYSAGFNVELGSTKISLKNFSYESDMGYNIKEKFKAEYMNFELYQRIRLLPAGITGLGLFWDAGVYGKWVYKVRYDLKYEISEDVVEITSLLSTYNKFQYGVRTRIGYGILSAYAQYRISDFTLNNLYTMPRLEAGVELAIPLGM